MRICFFGTYTLEEGYPVNKVILQGLRSVGAQVVECHARLWRQPQERWLSRAWFLSPLFWIHTLWIYIKLFFMYFRVGSYDLMVVGYLGHQDIFLARLLNLLKAKPIVFIAFNSLYETVVQDRNLFSPRHPIARFLHWLDRTACRLANLVLLDTQVHIDYFTREFKLPASKFLRVFVGSGLTFPVPVSSVAAGQETSQNVLFVGTYIPLHGIETIIRAAKILENRHDLQFTLLGQGQLYSEMQSLANQMGLQNLKLIGRWIPTSELINYIARADICLGIFGSGEKAQRVIPCKVFDALIMVKPLITADTPAARELLTHGDNALLCPPGDEQALARAILQLLEDPVLRGKVAGNGRETYLKSCAPTAIGNLLIQAFQKLTQTS
jgi:glycosyltransferase involved in cell wall biosynthesis